MNTHLPANSLRVQSGIAMLLLPVIESEFFGDSLRELILSPDEVVENVDNMDTRTLCPSDLAVYPCMMS